MEPPRLFIGKGDNTKVDNYLFFCKHWRRILVLVQKTAKNGDKVYTPQYLII